MITVEFLFTTFLVAIIPGIGVIYTISIAMFKNKYDFFYAAFGCTLGIIPHSILSVLSLSLLFNINYLFLELIKYVGIIYIIYLAILLWNNSGFIKFENHTSIDSKNEVLIKGFIINILNPKLTLFMLAFIPQFLRLDTNSLVVDIAILSSVFMIVTFLIFVLYGFAGSYLSKKFLNSKNKVQKLQRTFSIIFVLLCIVSIFS